MGVASCVVREWFCGWGWGSSTLVFKDVRGGWWVVGLFYYFRFEMKDWCGAC